MPTIDTESSSARPELKRAISGFGFFALAFGSMIGVGWITALGGWFEQAGPVGAIVAFMAGGALMLIIGLCYAEVTPMLPVTGGEVAYAYKAYGTSKAFVIGWFLAFGYLSVSSFEAISVGLVLSFLFPQIDVLPLYQIAGSTVYASHLLLAFVFTGFITAINYFGVAIASRVQIVLTGAFLLCALLFVVSGIASGEIGNLAPYFGDRALGSGGLAGMLAVFVTVPFWYVGFDTIPQAAEERREDSPLHRLGVYVILAIIGSTVFGEFKRLSQHLRKEEELRWRQASADGRIELCVRRWVHPVVPRWGAGSIGRGFGKKLLEGCRARSRRWQPACLPLLERAGFANVVACHLSVFVLCRGATYRSSSEKILRFFKPAVVAYVRSPGSCAAHRRRSRENCGGTQQREVETSSIEPRPPNGMPIGERSVRKLPNSLRTAN